MYPRNTFYQQVVRFEGAYSSATSFPVSHMLERRGPASVPGIVVKHQNCKNPQG